MDKKEERALNRGGISLSCVDFLKKGSDSGRKSESSVKEEAIQTIFSRPRRKTEEGSTKQ